MLFLKVDKEISVPEWFLCEQTREEGVDGLESIRRARKACMGSDRLQEVLLWLAETPRNVPRIIGVCNSAMIPIFNRLIPIKQ